MATKKRLTQEEREALPGWLPKPEYKAKRREELKEAVASAMGPEPDLRLHRLTIQNVMKIKFADIRPKGDVIVIGGKNGQGKSSALLAIGFLLFGGEIMPTDIIRAGEMTATIAGQLGPFKITRYFTRKGADEGRNNNQWRAAKIKIEGRMGEEHPRPQEFLDTILDQLSFDPMAFMHMDAKKQFAALKGMAKFSIVCPTCNGLGTWDADGAVVVCDECEGAKRVAFDLDALDAAQAKDYEARRGAKYVLDAVEARLKPLLTVECPECEGSGEMEVPKTHKDGSEAGGTKKRPCTRCKALGGLAPEAGDAPADAAELAKRLEEAAAWNAKVGTARGEKQRLEEEAARLKEKAVRLRFEAQKALNEVAEIDGLRARVDVSTEPDIPNMVSDRLEEASKVVIPDEIDTAEVSAQLAKALEGSAAIEQAKRTKALETEYDAAWALWSGLHEGMKARTELREAVMQSANMPVEGLGIGVDEVVYQGHPFNQASGAEQIRVSLAIGMAQNPKLKILRFMDGGWDMLDDDSQDLVRAEIEKHKYQLWAEHVGTKGAMTVMMEDGTASGDDVVAGDG